MDLIRLQADGVDLWSMAIPDSIQVVPEIIDDKNTGRGSNDPTMHRRIVGAKDTATAKFPPLCQEDMTAIAKLVYKEFVSVTYLSPRYGQRIGVQFYVKIKGGTIGNAMYLKRTHKMEPYVWKDVELTMVEK